jgi:hypothetical protein
MIGAWVGNNFLPTAQSANAGQTIKLFTHTTTTIVHFVE